MFLNDDFLLNNEWSKKLYHTYAKKQPIIDYHCHLSAKDVYENRQYENLTKIWLNSDGAGDHYKWRLMRANGVDENLISGNGDDYQKFLAFVKTLEKAIGNPIYEWSHLELKRYFGIDMPITEKNANAIWEKANALLATEEYRARNLLKKMNVVAVATTDDPADDLKYHKLLQAEEGKNTFKVYPTFRPDRAMQIQNENFLEYVHTLEKVVGFKIDGLKAFQRALEERVGYFKNVGCFIADHGLNTFHFTQYKPRDIEIIFANKMAGKVITDEDAVLYLSFMQIFFMKLYKHFNMTMQMHMNVFRNASAVNFKKIGVDAGFDSVGDQASLGRELLKLYSYAQEINAFPKSIWYTLNPNDLLVLATLMQSFQGEVKQRIQLGSAWWFSDSYHGMREQMTILASQSLFGNFVGMLTDSRSLLSYTRHEYFRRVLCGLVGEWVEAGRLPEDEEYLGKIISNICYYNAKEYFSL